MECVVGMGLKESKKYAIGSTHENGGGKFEIIDRWFDDKTDTIMLKYKFEDGKVEENKEANVNASEWKWRKVRGKAGGQAGNVVTKEALEAFTLMEENFEGVFTRIDKLVAEHKLEVEQNRDRIAENKKMLIELISMMSVQQKQVEALMNDRNVMNKLLEKI